jgi:hypothetical protein
MCLLIPMKELIDSYGKWIRLPLENFVENACFSVKAFRYARGLKKKKKKKRYGNYNLQ